MTRDDALDRLRAHEAEFKQLSVEHLYLFGSTARDAAAEDSDVDLFFDHPKGKIGLFELIDVQDRAAGVLNGRADVTTRRSLHPALRERIEASAILVF